MPRRRFLLRAIEFAFGFFVYSVALPSGASEKTQTRLVYVLGAGASACPPQMQLRMAVTARLGYDPFSATAPRTVIAAIEVISGQLEGKVELIDDESVSEGARQLKAPLDRCSELVRAMALSISIVIDPQSALAAHEEPEQSDSSVVPGSTPQVRADVPPKSEQSTSTEVPELRVRRPVRFFSGVGMQLTSGAGPSNAVGAHWFVGGRYGLVSLSMEERVDSRSSTDMGNASVHVSFWLASLVPCVHVGYAMLCGTGTFGMIRASSSGLETDSSQTGAYTAFGGRFGLDIPIVEKWSAGLYAEAFAPWHPVTVKTNERVLWTAPNWASLLGFRMTVHY